MCTRQVTYKTIGDVRLMLDVFVPKVRDASSRLPGIVFFHGGGWEIGSPSQFHAHCQYFASRGLVAMAVEYRLIQRHGTTPFECVSDGKSAIRWIRAHAAELGIDANKLIAGGGSAGGQIAAATAMVSGFNEKGEDCSISATPEALVLFNPALDTGPGGPGYDRVKDRWQEFSPMHNIAKGAPPTIIFLGTKDLLIPVSTMREFKKRMNAVGSRCDVWEYDGQPHGFFNYKNGSNPYYDATVYEADRFLASLGYLNGEPMLQKKTVEATRL